MADITIIRNGARISLANFPKLGSGSENIAVAVSASGAYDTYTTELYYGWYQGSSMQRMLAQYQNGLYYIPSNALFNAGNVYLTLRLVSGGNKVSTNTIPITIEKSAVNNEYSILPASETWQKAVDNYLNNSINLLNEKFDSLNTKVENEIPPLKNRLDNIVANAGDSNTEIVDARVGYDNTAYRSLGESIRKQIYYSFKTISTVDANNYSTVLPDLTNAPDNSIISLQFENGSKSIPANYPSSSFIGGHTNNNLLITQCTSTYVCSQYIIADDTIYSRVGMNKNYGAWSVHNTNFFGADSIINADNYSSLLPDLDKAENGSIYCLQFENGSINIPKNYPAKTFIGSATNNNMLITSVSGDSIKSQYLIADNMIYTRVCGSGGYGQWISPKQSKVLRDMFDRRINEITNGYLRNTNYTDGKFRYYENGNPIDDSNYCYSDYIPVNPSTTYYGNLLENDHIAFFDENFMSVNSGALGTPFTTTANTYYITVSVAIGDKDNRFLSHDKYGENLNGKNTMLLADDVKIKQLLSNNIIVVDKGGNGDYTSVTTACEKAPEHSIIYVRSGVYDDEVILATREKELYIFGENKYTTIIKNRTGDYNKAPLMLGAGYIKNLTLYAEKDPNVMAPDHHNYAVHVECHYLSGRSIIFDNCILKSDWGAAFGLGMRKNCNVELLNCDIICTANNDTALYMHDSDYDEYAGTQNVSIRNCVLNNTGANGTAIIIQSQNKTGTVVNLEVIGTLFKCTSSQVYKVKNWNGGTPTEKDFLGCISWRLKNTSWNNSDSNFNA